MEETYLTIKIAITPQQLKELGDNKLELEEDLKRDLLTIVIEKLHWRLKK